jgi:hypothetical protein
MAEQYIYKEALAATLKTHFPGIECLKPQQEDAIIKFMQRRDVFAVLPTGWGKSLIFQIVPAVCSHFHDIGLPFFYFLQCPVTVYTDDRRAIVVLLYFTLEHISKAFCDPFFPCEYVEIAQFYIARNFRITYSTVNILAFIQFLWSFGGCRSFFHLYYYTVI